MKRMDRTLLAALGCFLAALIGLAALIIENANEPGPTVTITIPR